LCYLWGRFLSALDGVTDPEVKRKTIGNLFIEVFQEEAKDIGSVDYLLQGTLYPDVIESISYKVRNPLQTKHVICIYIRRLISDSLLLLFLSSLL
jgi:GMP synthase PP-ATPase subunit